MFRKSLWLTLVASIMVIALLLPACSSQTPAKAIYLKGWAFTDEPVVNADVAVYSTDGKLLKKEAKATNNLGFFVFEIENLPSEFSLAVSNGTRNGQLFDTTLKANYAAFNSEIDTAYINPVTSMISAYLAQHQGKTLEQSQLAVKRMLQMPDFADVGAGILIEHQYFSQDLFFAEAQKNGGMSQYIETLAADAAIGASHPFPAQATNGPGAFIAQYLAAGVVSYIGGAAFGWVLNQIGLGDPIPGQTIALLQQISAQLAQLKSQVESLQRQLNGVDYNVLAAPLTDTVSTIKTTHERILNYAAIVPTDANKTWRDIEKTNILNLIGGPAGIMAHEDSINIAMMGQGTAGGGMIQKWSRSVAGQHKFFDQGDSDMQTAMFNYWDQLQAIQCELIVEYMHANGAPSNDIQSHIDKYNNNNAAQAAIAPRALPLNNDCLLITTMAPGDSGTGIMIDTRTAYDLCSYDQAVQTINFMNGRNSYGFNNWKIPHFIADFNLQSAECRAMFQNPTPPGDLKAWASSQGWDYTNSYGYVDNFPPGDFSCFTDATVWTYDGLKGAWEGSERSNGLSPDNVRVIFMFTEYQGRGGYYKVPFDWSSYLLAVRDLAPGEFYFYK